MPEPFDVREGRAGTNESRPPAFPERLVGALAWAGAAAATVLVLITLVAVGYSVVKRYVLDTPVTWTDELSGYLVVAIVMLGAAEALRRGDHISVDLLTNRMGRRGQRYVALWGLLATAMFAGAVIYSAVLMVRFSFSFGVYSEGYLGVPMWIPQSVLLAGSALLLVVAVAGIVVLFIRR